MTNYERADDDADRDDRQRSLVALFGDRESASDAAHELHAEHFHHVWMGITHASDGGSADTMRSYDTGTSAMSTSGAGSGIVVESSGGESLGDKLGRFFSGESATRSLADELVRHGIETSEARRIENQIPAGSVVVTVDGSNHPEAAANIIERCGGHVIAGEGFDVSDDTSMSDRGAAKSAAFDAAMDRRGSEVLGYRDPQRYARGEAIDDERRLQLRAERLNVDKRREAIGEATIGKDVVEQRQELDVPLVREELFVQRRAPQATATDVDADTDVAVGAETEAIRIPLMRERVVVTKRPVLREEVVVGKRSVTENEHVSETTREERLRVDDASVRGNLGDSGHRADRTDLND